MRIESPPASAPGAKIRRTSNQSIGTGTYLAAQFDTVDWEIGGEFADLASQSTRLTIPAAGRYLLVGGYRFGTNGAGVRDIRFVKNGVDILSFDRKAAITSGGGTYQRLSDVVDLAAADFVEMQVWQNSGSPLNLEPEGQYSVAFAIVRIGG